MKNMAWAMIAAAALIVAFRPLNLETNELVLDDLDTSVVHVYLEGSAGTGFFVDEEHFVTNFHVTQGSQSVNFRIMDDLYGYRADLVDASEFHDIAVYRVPDDDIEILERFNGEIVPLDFADSYRVEPGEKVWGVGSGLGFEFNLTEGIVTNTRILSQNGVFVMTDTLILPGNSGGPLLNEQLEVVGINTFTLSEMVGPLVNSDHIGGAIPGSLADRIVRQVVAGDEITQNRIGIAMLHIPTNHYPTVMLVHPNEAVKGTFQEQDRVMSVRKNGGPRIMLNNVADITLLTASSDLDDILEFVVLRGDDMVTFTTSVHDELPPIDMMH